MAEWPNVVVPGKISALLEHIKRVNRPAKVTGEWLVAAGFKSSNDKGLIALLKALGYLDASGIPTDQWADLKGADAVRAASVGCHMQDAYPEVFANWPVTIIRDSLTKDALRDFINPKIAAGAPTVNNIVATFFALKGLATFDGPLATDTPPRGPSVGTTSNPAVAADHDSRPPSGQPLNVTINLTLEIPQTSDPGVYDKLFEAMAKHLGTLLKRGS